MFIIIEIAKIFSEA